MRRSTLYSAYGFADAEGAFLTDQVRMSRLGRTATACPDNLYSQNLCLQVPFEHLVAFERVASPIQWIPKHLRGTEPVDPVDLPVAHRSMGYDACGAMLFLPDRHLGLIFLTRYMCLACL